MLVFTFTMSSEQASAVTVARCTQTVCDMIRNSIYRCYGIIPTIKEVSHLPNDLRLASQDTENDLMAMSFNAMRLGFNVCVWERMQGGSLHAKTLVSLERSPVCGVWALSAVKVGESGMASKHVYQAISRLAGRSLGGPLWSILHW